MQLVASNQDNPNLRGVSVTFDRIRNSVFVRVFDPVHGITATIEQGPVSPVDFGDAPPCAEAAIAAFASVIASLVGGRVAFGLGFEFGGPEGVEDLVLQMAGPDVRNGLRMGRIEAELPANVPGRVSHGQLERLLSNDAKTIAAAFNEVVSSDARSGMAPVAVPEPVEVPAESPEPAPDAQGHEPVADPQGQE